VKCLSVDGQHNCSRGVNGSARSVRIDGLKPDAQYNVEIAALTSQGTGAWSSVYASGLKNTIFLKNNLSEHINYLLKRIDIVLP